MENLQSGNSKKILINLLHGDFAFSMVDGGFRNIPIVDEKRKPIGQVSILDVVNHLGQFFPNTLSKMSRSVKIPDTFPSRVSIAQPIFSF